MRIFKTLAAYLFLCVVLCLTIPAVAEEIRVAAAADLSFAMKDVAARFEAQTGNKVVLSFGSSGNFYAEIGNGAPFDVFCSADTSYPQQLINSGLAFSDSLYAYARGSIVLWAPKGSTLDLKRGLDVLLDPAVHKIAIANPRHAPYGRAAEAALRSHNLWDRVQDKLILGENIAQTAQFVTSGNADVGILALSLALSAGLKDQGRYELIPSADYPPMNQAAVVLKSSRHEKVARAFVEFLKKKEIQDLLHQYGFEPADAEPQTPQATVTPRA
jgi:molybdate transport system substrate-binding protein